MKTITGQIGAWLSSYNVNTDPSDISNLFFANSDMSTSGWVKVGDATVTVELVSDTDLLTGQLAMLDEAERRADAECQRIKNEIEGQRQRLLAIEYKPCQTTEG